MNRGLGFPFGSERFSKNKRFLLMMGGQKDSFATRGFPSLLNIYLYRIKDSAKICLS